MRFISKIFFWLFCKKISFFVSLISTKQRKVQYDKTKRVYSASLGKYNKCIHLTIKDFKCSECDKSFANISNLYSHRKCVHLEVGDFQCIDCNYSFFVKSKLDQHIKMVTLEIKHFKCSKCDENFL